MDCFILIFFFADFSLYENLLVIMSNGMLYASNAVIIAFHDYENVVIKLEMRFHLIHGDVTLDLSIYTGRFIVSH